MKKGAIGWTPGIDIFLFVEFITSDFVGHIILCTAEDTSGPAVG